MKQKTHILRGCLFCLSVMLLLFGLNSSTSLSSHILQSVSLQKKDATINLTSPKEQKKLGSFGYQKNKSNKKLGRLPNLSSGGIKYDRETGDLDILLGSRVNSFSLANHNVSVLRLGDVKSIICSSEYSLKAVVFKKTENGKFEKYSQITGEVNQSMAGPEGVESIDFSPYNFDGYVRIAIGPKKIVNDIGSNNILAGREKVLKNVFVEYKDGVIIEHAKSPCSIFTENIKTFCKLGTRPTYNYNYVFPLLKNKKKIGVLQPSFTSPSLGWYAGGFVANVPLCNVSWESFCTATHNKWSRYYQARYNPKDISDSQSIVQQYGSRCTGMECYAYGWSEQYRTRSITEKIYDNTVFATEKMHIIDDWAWKDVKIGDMLLWTGHVVVVTDIVSINGNLNSVEVIEFYPPYARYRTIFLGNGQPNDEIDKEFSLTEPSNGIKVIARPNYNLIKRIDEKWNLTDSGFKPELLMCDRGHNSVYTTGNAYVNLTVTDNLASSIIFTVNGEKPQAISLSDDLLLFKNETERVYNIASYITSPGVYNLTLDTQSKRTLETFYVPDTSGITVSKKGTVYRFSSPYKAIYAMVAYGTKSGGRRYWITVAPELIVNNSIKCEPYLTSVGDKLPLNYIIIVFETRYGTFAYRSDGYATSSSI